MEEQVQHFGALRKFLWHFWRQTQASQAPLIPKPGALAQGPFEGPELLSPAAVQMLWHWRNSTGASGIPAVPDHHCELEMGRNLSIPIF